MSDCEMRDRCQDVEAQCLLPSPWPYPRPGIRAMVLLPLAYVVMGFLYFLALRSPTNGFWYPPIAFGKLLLLVYGPWAVLPVLLSELALMGVQYVLVAKLGVEAAGLVSLATTAEALLAWWLLRRWPIDAAIPRSRDLRRLLVYGGLLPNLAGAVIGVALLRLFVSYGHGQIAPAALLWAFGDFVTTVTWLPAFVVWVGPLLCGGRAELPRGRQLAELAVILAASVAACGYVALGVMHRPELQEYHLKFVCFLPLIWAGIRFGLPGVSASLAVSSTAWAMLYGNARPADIVDLALTIEQVQVFNLAMGIGGLALGCVIDAERRARVRAQALSDELMAKDSRLREAFDLAGRAQDRAQRAGEVKYRLLSAVSHELRTPLTPMALVLSELVRRDDVPADVRESAEMAMRQVEVEISIVEELLEYADLMCGAEIRRSETTWQSLAAPVLPQIERAAREADVDVTWTLPDPRSRLMIDGRKVARAMLHTIGHAIRLSMPRGEVQVLNSIKEGALRVECRIRSPRKGSDIASEPLALSQQLSGTNDGLGLALATTRIIAQRHGGSLEITQSAEDGSISCTLTVRQVLDSEH